jgi:hypothetical protein
MARSTVVLADRSMINELDHRWGFRGLCCSLLLLSWLALAPCAVSVARAADPGRAGRASGGSPYPAAVAAALGIRALVLPLTRGQLERRLVGLW